jgi:hypothetical protein
MASRPLDPGSFGTGSDVVVGVASVGAADCVESEDVCWTGVDGRMFSIGGGETILDPGGGDVGEKTRGAGANGGGDRTRGGGEKTR